MTDVNAEAEKTLSKLDYTVEYYYPKKFNDLPVISFYNLTENPDFSADNNEVVQSGCVVVDIWADEPSDCGKIAVEVNDVMTADNWSREFSRDLPPDNSGVHHKTMRFSKDFLL